MVGLVSRPQGKVTSRTLCDVPGSIFIQIPFFPVGNTCKDGLLLTCLSVPPVIITIIITLPLRSSAGTTNKRMGLSLSLSEV